MLTIKEGLFARLTFVKLFLGTQVHVVANTLARIRIDTNGHNF